ncbi:hypothetical protein M758_UG131800 [Ceratodon purpureus]|nr:hypothetical protein M758_UG131800 [Ceratodon purpureus]
MLHFVVHFIVLSPEEEPGMISGTLYPLDCAALSSQFICASICYLVLLRKESLTVELILHSASRHRARYSKGRCTIVLLIVPPLSRSAPQLRFNVVSSVPLFSIFTELVTLLGRSFRLVFLQSLIGFRIAVYAVDPVHRNFRQTYHKSHVSNQSFGFLNKYAYSISIEFTSADFNPC